MESNARLADLYMRYNLVMMGVMTFVTVFGASFICWMVWQIYKIAQKHELTMQNLLSELRSRIQKPFSNKPGDKAP